MIRWVRGVDFTDMLISAPCYSYSIFYGSKVRTFNFRPGAELVDAMVDAFKDLTVPFVSPALLNQLLPVGVPQTKEQQEIVKEQSGPIRKWEQPKAQPVQEKKNKGCVCIIPVLLNLLFHLSLLLENILGKMKYICPHKYKKTLFCHEEIRKHSYR